MIPLPPALLQSLENLPGFDKEAFEAVHLSGEQVTSIRFNPSKLDAEKTLDLLTTHHSPLLTSDSRLPTHDSRLPTPVPWSSHGYYLPERPSFTFDPLFHAGVYYVQEASSMFVEQALKQTADLSQPLRVLDLCAAPGGKSTLLQSLISKESLLVSNDVIKSRAAILEENMIKWGAANVVVTNNDPVHFARLENYFDVIVIDAPCSGSGLFRRDTQAIDEWSENNVALCSQRQQRIIADVWPALKEDGIIIYSTCSYSAAEDEYILDWVGREMKAESKQLSIAKDWHIVEVQSPEKGFYGYRFYPDRVAGEGFFIAAMQKKDGASFEGFKSGKTATDHLTKAEEAIAKLWLQETAELILFRQKEDVIALPASLQKEIPVLQSALYIKKAGVTLGEFAGKDLIPDHQLAVSGILNKNLPHIELNRQQAVQYLRKEEIRIETQHRGWALVTCQGHPLGWVKILPNRVNNYYPKEWRILKQPS